MAETVGCGRDHRPQGSPKTKIQPDRSKTHLDPDEECLVAVGADELLAVLDHARSQEPVLSDEVDVWLWRDRLVPELRPRGIGESGGA